MTLHDLVIVIRQDDSPFKGMLISTLSKFLEFIGQTAEDTSIDLLKTKMEPFLQHLRSGKYKANSVKSYRNFVNILLKLAGASGWTEAPFEVPAAWQILWDAIEEAVVRDIMSFAIELRRKPKDFSEDDLSAWRLNQVKAGYSFGVAGRMCSRFRTAAVNAGLAHSLPLIKFKKAPYGVPLAKMGTSPE